MKRQVRSLSDMGSFNLWEGSLIGSLERRDSCFGYYEGVSFGLTFEKILIIGIIAIFLVGPDRLPLLSSKLARVIREVRKFFLGAKTQFREEFGPELDQFTRPASYPFTKESERRRDSRKDDLTDADSRHSRKNGAASEQRNDFSPASSVPFDPDVS